MSSTVSRSTVVSHNNNPPLTLRSWYGRKAANLTPSVPPLQSSQPAAALQATPQSESFNAYLNSQMTQRTGKRFAFLRESLRETSQQNMTNHLLQKLSVNSQTIFTKQDDLKRANQSFAEHLKLQAKEAEEKLLKKHKLRENIDAVFRERNATLKEEELFRCLPS